MKNLPDVPVPSQRLSRRWIIKRALGWGIVAFVPLRFWFATREPVVTFPPVSLPNPNAFDVFVRACGQMVQIEKIAEAVSPAATPPIKTVTVSLAEKLLLLQANAAALATFREGLPLSYCEPPVRYEDSSSPFALFTLWRNCLFWKATYSVNRANCKMECNPIWTPCSWGKLWRGVER